MTSLTTNIKLLLTGADEVGMTFLEWRTAMDGIGSNSNMELIDAAIGNLMKSNEKKQTDLVLIPKLDFFSLPAAEKPWRETILLSQSI